MATNITQQYDRNVEFNTYTQAELLSDVWGELSRQWRWEGRTLSCLQLSDGTQINPGDPLTLDADYTAISGIWTMNMSPDPIKIYFIGDSGEVSVKITEKNLNKPLGSPSLPFTKVHDVSNKDIDGNLISECSVYVNAQTDWNPNPGSWSQNTYLRFDVNKKEGTTITGIYWGNQLIGNTPMSWCTDNVSPSGEYYYARQWDADACRNDRQYGLSVFFTTQGTLTYYPNK